MQIKMLKKIRRVAAMLLLLMATGCGALPSLSYTPIDAQLGKENTMNTVASQSNTSGNSNALTMNSSASMIASFFSGGVLSLLTSLGFIYIIIKDRKDGQTNQATNDQSVS